MQCRSNLQKFDAVGEDEASEERIPAHLQYMLARSIKLSLKQLRIRQLRESGKAMDYEPLRNSVQKE